MTLRGKIMAGYGITLLLVILVCAWAVANLWRLGTATDRILRENYLSILAAESMIGSLERQDSAVLLIVLGFEKEGHSQFRGHEAKFLQWLGRAKGNITIKGEGELLDRLEKSYTDYLSAFSRFREVEEAPKGEQGTFYHQTMLPLFNTVRQECSNLREMNEKSMISFSEEAGIIARRAVWSTMAIGAVAVLAGLIFSLVLATRLVRPLREMIHATSEIAVGNYGVTISVSASDELGRLARDFSEMSRRLKAFHEINLGKLVAEKRRTEAIIRSVGDGLLVVDKDLKIVGINPAAGEALNTHPEEALGRHVLELIEDKGLFKRIRDAAEGRSAEEGREEQPIFISAEKGGRLRHFQVSVTPVRTNGGKLVGTVALFQDVTKLKELDRLKTEFVMAASHELRTPLTSMILSIGSLREQTVGKLGPTEAELLGAAREEAERLKALVNDLLDLSRLESGKLKMEFRPVKLHLLAQQVIYSLEPEARQRQINLTRRVAEDIPPVWADGEKITWILTNLVGNAFRYTNAGGKVQIGARQEGRSVYVWVSDNGSGIPLQDQERIFQKFASLENPGRSGGSGLGLALCKELVQKHHGDIWVDSQPGKGATFTFTLPISDQARKVEEDDGPIQNFDS